MFIYRDNNCSMAHFHEDLDRDGSIVIEQVEERTNTKVTTGPTLEGN